MAPRLLMSTCMKLVVVLVAALAAQGCVNEDLGAADRPAGSAEQSGDSVAPATPPASGPRIGFVLAHGLGGSVDSFDPAIVAGLQSDGFYVLRDSVPPVESVAIRAATLATQVNAFIATYQLDRVHLIAHSMGGLDGRYLISTLKSIPKIASLTTLSTPHRGSPLADIGLGIADNLSTSQQDALLALGEFLGRNVNSQQLERALTDLSETNAPTFNAANPDSATVKYYSYAGYSSLFGLSNPNAEAACAAAGATTPSPSSLPGILRLAGPIVAGGGALRPHDGVVPIDSSKWTGFLGCLPTDHLDMTRAGAKPAAELEIDLVPFYRQIAARVTTR